MGLITITVIAIGLAMDALAVSIVSGSICKQLHIKHALRIAVFFGGFQALMPLVGSLAGISFKGYVADYDHWIAFALLSAVGIKMIYESFKITPANFNPENVFVLLVLSIATSIDALAIGITLSLLRVSIVTTVIVIGVVTFVLSYLGVIIGKKFGHFFESKIEAVGGLVLITLGLKILIEHLFF